MAGFEIVWRRIIHHQRETFRQKRGKAFSYTVQGGSVLPSTTNRLLPKSDFERALSLMPLDGPGEIQDLQGPSYIYAILTDPRIASSAHGAGAAQAAAGQVLVVDLAQEGCVTSESSSAENVLDVQLDPLPASAVHGQQATLGGFEFRLVGTIEVDRDAAGRPQESMPQARYENLEGLPLNAHGRGPFCSFRVRALEPVPGVYALTVGGVVKYVGKCDSLAERFGPRGYGAIQPKNCFRGGQAT